METTANSSTLNLGCTAAVAVDHRTGLILYKKNEDKRLPIGSLTKVMTAILAIEKGDLDSFVTIPNYVTRLPGSVVKLKPGTSIRLEELIYGMLLCSGNDAAYTVAQYIGGGLKDFILMMNSKAKALGAFNTNFVVPDGFDNSYHFSTAGDMVKIASYAMNNPFFAKVVSTKETGEGINGAFKNNYKNTNNLLFTDEKIDGVKTGWTPLAGECLIASRSHSEGRIISVVLNSKNRWEDSKSLLNYAYKIYAESTKYQK